MFENIRENFALIAVISAAFGALANIFARTLLKDLKAKNILAVNFLTMGVTLILVSPWFYFFQPSVLAVSLVVFIAFIDTLANYFFFKTFENTEASVATPILSLAPVFTFILSFIFLDDPVRLIPLVISLAIIGLIVFFSSDFKNFRNFQIATLRPALIASILFGISAIPSKYLLSNLEAINSLTLYMFRAGLIGLFALLFFSFSIRDVTNRQFRIIFFRGLIVIAQWSLLYWALSMGQAGVTVTLANITPIFVFILGAIFLSEKITLKKVIASVLVLALSFFI